MAGNVEENYNYRSEAARKAEAEGATSGTPSLLKRLYAWLFDIKSAFNQWGRGRSDSEKPIMDRAEEDYIENTFSSPKAKYQAYEEKAVRKVSDIAKDKAVGLEDDIESIYDFSAVSGKLAQGADKDKEGGFCKSVHEKFNNLLATKANLVSGDEEALKKYYEEAKEVQESLREYSESHNPWGRLGKKRKEFADSVGYLLGKEIESLEEENPSFTDEEMTKDDIAELNKMTDFEDEEEMEIPKERIGIKDISEKSKEVGKTSVPGMSEKNPELGDELG